MTLDIFGAAESGSWLWVAWRPAIVIWLTLATLGALAWRRQWALLIPGALFAIHLLNVAGTSLNHEYRLAFPLYVAGLMSLPLWWFVVFPEPLQRSVNRDVSNGGSLFDDDVASVGRWKR